MMSSDDHSEFGWSQWVRMITVGLDDHSGFGWLQWIQSAEEWQMGKFSI